MLKIIAVAPLAITVTSMAVAYLICVGAHWWFSSCGKGLLVLNSKLSKELIRPAWISVDFHCLSCSTPHTCQQTTNQVHRKLLSSWQSFWNSWPVLMNLYMKWGPVKWCVGFVSVILICYLKTLFASIFVFGTVAEHHEGKMVQSWQSCVQQQCWPARSNRCRWKWNSCVECRWKKDGACNTWVFWETGWNWRSAACTIAVPKSKTWYPGKWPAFEVHAS